MSIIHLPEISRGHPCLGTEYRWGIKISRLSTISRCISQTIQDSTIVTIEGEQETAPELLNGTSSITLNDH